MATAAAGETGHDGPIALVADEAASGEGWAVLATEYQEAQNELVRGISCGDGIDQAYASLNAARESIADASAIIMPDLIDDLSAEDQALAERAVANLGIDPDLRSLDLGDDQRTVYRI